MDAPEHIQNPNIQANQTISIFGAKLTNFVKPISTDTVADD
jgi:hypothetical protein